MEKAGLLIARLQELYDSNAGNEQLRITAQLLLSELERSAQNEQYRQESIVVFYPAARSAIVSETSIETILPPVSTDPQQPAPIIETEEKEEAVFQPDEEEDKFNYFNPMVEIPTLALKQQEVNETLSQQESLNDRLKQQSSSQKEVAQNISTGPIKDLRKGIGINDQYLFINELFRGDQTMYDRSIKTINSFNIYGEAELWIKRELKLKLGWNENSPASVLFDQLIRRRFS